MNAIKMNSKCFTKVLSIRGYLMNDKSVINSKFNTK